MDTSVAYRAAWVEVIVAHQGRDGVHEVAWHLVSTAGHPRLDLSHYPPRPASKILDHRPARRTPGEAAFLALSPGAARWLTAAAAAGTTRVRMKMGQVVESAAVHGDQGVDAALAAAAEPGRFAAKDLASILRHRRRIDSDGVVVPLIEGHSLQTGTARWTEVDR